MGSDSRTATASSKSRPSWRDRHLSQLNDEQLDEVSRHRGSEVVSVAEMAGVGSDSLVENESSAASTDSFNNEGVIAPGKASGDVSPAQPPRQQAGPERSRRSQPVERDSYQAVYQAPLRENRFHESERGGARYRDDRFEESLDNRNENRSERNWRRADRYEPAARYGSSDERAEASYNHDPRSNAESDGVAFRSAPDVEAQSENKKGFVDKVLDFQMPAAVKYSLMALAIAAMVAVSLLKPIDNSSQSQLESAFIRASIGFGLARALNGVISVAQGTEFAVQPAGVGVNFSPGEILDPINDLVERFSWVMLLATSSIGIQQILLQISSWTGVSILLGGAGLFFLLTRLRGSSFARMADIAGKLLLAMLLVRFLVPVGSLANDWVYKQFLQPQYEESAAELEIASERIKEISTRQAEAQESDGSITDRAKKLYSSMTSKFDFDGMLDDYKQSAETVSENAINLIVVFVLQTILFPLLFMYLIYRLFRSVLLPSRRPQ